MTAETDLLHCAECGMPCEPGEYHPFAACLMFKASRNSTVVRANLRSVQRHATAARDAEIKALRAGSDFLGSVIATHAADTREYQKRISQTEARAERLAEALRGWIWARENGASEELAVQYATAALEQENDDA